MNWRQNDDDELWFDAAGNPRYLRPIRTDATFLSRAESGGPIDVVTLRTAEAGPQPAHPPTPAIVTRVQSAIDLLADRLRGEHDE